MFDRSDSGFRRVRYQLVHLGEETLMNWKQSILLAAVLAYAVMLCCVNQF